MAMVRESTTTAKIMYHHHGGFFERMSMFMPNRPYYDQI
jgi:hypothetical protein